VVNSVERDQIDENILFFMFNSYEGALSFAGYAYLWTLLRQQAKYFDQMHR